jgi:hypothetical protein
MGAFLKKLAKGLGKVAKVVLPVVGVITGIGAIGGIAKGVGALRGIGGILAGGKKVIDKVGVSAVNLVTGTTQIEREQVKEQKSITKSITDKIEQVQRLIKAGASEASARATVGVSDYDMPSIATILPDSIQVDEYDSGKVVATTKKVIEAGTGCALITAMLATSAGALIAGLIIILISL